MTIVGGSKYKDLSPESLKRLFSEGALRQPCINCRHLLGLLGANPENFEVDGRIEYEDNEGTPFTGITSN